MKQITIIILSMLIGYNLQSQETRSNEIQLGVKGGYDFIQNHSDKFTYYSVDSGYKVGASIDYFFGSIGLGFDYDLIINNPSSTISDSIFYEELQINSSRISQKIETITRHFLGLGPTLKIDIGKSVQAQLFGRVGYSIIHGGEIITTSQHPIDDKVDHHLMFSGFDAASLAVKGGIGIRYRLRKNVALNIGAYYLNQFSVRPDRSFELNSRGNMGIVYGHTPFAINQNYAISQGVPYLLNAPKDLNEFNESFGSVGVSLGLTVLIGSQPQIKDVEEALVAETTENLDGKSKIIIKVEDELTKKVIPNADVILKNKSNQIVATGITNGFGLVEFSKLLEAEYTVSGLVYGVKTSTSIIRKEEMNPTAPLNRSIVYTDLRFILKGRAVNSRTRTGEPGVSVSLTKNTNRSVQQESTNGDGSFGFALDKNSSYNLVGVKENKLSDIKSVTTKGLTRSTTLFVDLELGVENFDCGRGTILDITYEFDKWELVEASKYEIDRVIRYMTNHSNAKIQLSAHTDSRGDASYNLSLSEKRAQAVLEYMQSRGINPSRVIAQGFGETLLKNHCDDNSNCSEIDHSVNRRTEAMLICR